MTLNLSSIVKKIEGSCMAGFKVNIFYHLFVLILFSLNSIVFAADCGSDSNNENQIFIYPAEYRLNIWKNSEDEAVLYYKFKLDSDFKPLVKCTAEILAAMLDITNKTGILFYPATAETEDYVLIDVTKPGDVGSSAAIGRQGGKQSFNLQPSHCNEPDVIQHELLHSLGMHHTQKRWDRDNFIEILWDNISENEKYNFKKMENYKDIYRRYFCDGITDLECKEMWTYFPLKYDYYSIMHYSPYVFSKNDEPTLKPKNEKIKNIGGVKLSESDIGFLMKLYQTKKPLIDLKLNEGKTKSYFIYKSVVGKNEEGEKNQFTCTLKAPCKIEIKCSGKTNWSVPIKLNDKINSKYYMVGAQTLKKANITPSRFCDF
jgi:hypothetical protein